MPSAPPHPTPPHPIPTPPHPTPPRLPAARQSCGTSLVYCCYSNSSGDVSSVPPTWVAHFQPDFLHYLSAYSSGDGGGDGGDNVSSNTPPPTVGAPPPGQQQAAGSGGLSTGGEAGIGACHCGS